MNFRIKNYTIKKSVSAELKNELNSVVKNLLC